MEKPPTSVIFMSTKVGVFFQILYKNPQLLIQKLVGFLRGSGKNPPTFVHINVTKVGGFFGGSGYNPQLLISGFQQIVCQKLVVFPDPTHNFWYTKVGVFLKKTPTFDILLTKVGGFLNKTPNFWSQKLGVFSEKPPTFDWLLYKS